MRKGRNVFLIVGRIVFAISVIAFAVNTIISAINSYEIAVKDDIYGASGEWFWICLNILLIPTPFLLSEWSFIKSVNTLLTENQTKTRKILCVVSAVLSLLVIIMILLVIAGLFKHPVSNAILLLLWPMVIASIVIGILHRKSDKEE